MRANLTLGFVLIAGLLAAPAHAFRSGEHLELLEVNEVVDEYGLMTFAGTVQNNHTTQAITGISAYVILKKEGRIIAIYRGWLDGAFSLSPGETGSFLVEADYAEGEYDEFYVRLDGLLKPPEADFITGELVLIEESLNLTSSADGQTVLYGELFNGTNAIIGSVNLQFNLLDARGRVVGIAVPLELGYIELWPGEKIDFTAIGVLTSDRRISSWDVEIEFEAIRLAESDVPTVATGATWGQIKHRIGEEE